LFLIATFSVGVASLLVGLLPLLILDATLFLFLALLRLPLPIGLLLLVVGLPALLILSLTFVIPALLLRLPALAVVVSLVVVLCTLLVLGFALFSPTASVGTVVLRVNDAADREQRQGGNRETEAKATNVIGLHG
jgi:hypothetical protein